MSTVTRRNKAALAAGKTRKVDTLPLAEFSDDEQPNGNGHGAKPKVRAARPILSNLEPASNYEFTDHALARMNERAISPAEVYSTIIDPEVTAVDENDKTLLNHDRGDIRVVVDPKTFSVVTVIDLDEDARMTKRTPQWANLVSQTKIPAVLPPAQRVPRKPKELPESEEVNWLFAKHSKEDVRFIDVSPVIAAALLERNTRNRPKRGGDVVEWSGEMAGGRWKTTSQGIGIARDGIIVDGQHRLEAIVESGVTVRMVVVVGLDPEVFSVTDTGRKRNPADAMSMVGEGNAAAYAAVLRLALQYDSGMLSAGKKAGGHITRRLHSDVMLAYRAGKEESLREAVRFGVNARSMGLTINKTAAGTAYFLIHRACNDDDLIEEFFEGVRTGVNLSVDDPRYVLRRVMLNDPKTVSVKHLALILKAWRMFATGSRSRLLSFRDGEEMPVVFTPPPKG